MTGGGDSVLNVWEDVTKEEEEVALLKAEAMVEKEQALQNSVYRKDYFQVWFSSVCHCFFFGSVCFCVVCLHDWIFISSACVCLYVYASQIDSSSQASAVTRTRPITHPSALP